MDADFIKSSGEMELFVNRSRSEVMDPENLTFIVNSFRKCGLREDVEQVIDLLWNLFYAKLPKLYHEYAHLARKGLLRDWRDIVEEEVKNLSHKRKLLYCPPSN
jgi:hypothetical protein